MTPISTRFAAVAVIICGLAVAWVWPRWFDPSTRDPCADPKALHLTGRIRATAPGSENEGGLTEGTIQFTVATVGNPVTPRLPLEARLVRSYNVLDLAESPLSLLPGKVEPDSAETDWVETEDGPMPITVVRQSGGQPPLLVTYMYLLGLEPVAHPFPALLRRFARLDGAGREPLTVLMVSGPSTKRTARKLQIQEQRWIADAYEFVTEICSPGPAQDGAPAAEAPELGG